MYVPSILHLLTTSLHLILICWTINALCVAWFMYNFWELPCCKMKADKPQLVFSSTASWSTDGYRGRKWKTWKGGKTRILGRNSVPVMKGPWEIKDWHIPRSLNNQVPGRSINITVTALYNIILGFWFQHLVQMFGKNVTAYFYFSSFLRKISQHHVSALR